MIEYQVILDAIRECLLAEADWTADRVSLLAEEYATKCVETNDRLRMCGERLRKGLRAEAIELCEHEPQLLDVVAMLDFPDRQAWCELLARFQVKQPPRLDLDTAELLNAEYPSHQRITQLLERYRLQMLARCPLNQSLATLRKIAASDPGSQLWESQIREFERVWLNTLRERLVRAAQANDLPKVRAFRNELQQANWLEQPAPDLLKFAEQHYLRLKAIRTRVELEPLVEPLLAAYQNLDLPTAEGVREEWDRILAEGHLPAGDELLDRVQDAIAWIDLERQTAEEFRLEIHSIRQGMLKPGLTVDGLTRLFQRLRRFNREIPDYVRREFETRRMRIEQAKRWRRMLIGASCAVVALVTFGIWQLGSSIHAQNEQANQAVAQIKMLLGSKDFEQIKGLFDKWRNENAPFLPSREIQSLHAEFTTLYDAEQLNVASSNRYIQDAKGLLNGDTLTTATETRINTYLTQAETLAKETTKGEDIREEIANVRNTLAERRQEMTTRSNEANKQFGQKVDSLRAQLEALPVDDASVSKASLDEIMKEANALVSGSLLLSDELQNRVKQLHNDVDNRSKRFNSFEAQVSELSKLEATVGNVDKFKGALTAFNQQFPTVRRSEDFRRVLDNDVPNASAAESLAELIDDWRKSDLLTLSPVKASELIDKLNKVLNNPVARSMKVADEIPAKFSFLTEIVKRGERARNSLENTKNFLEGKLFQLFVTHVRSENTWLPYYSEKMAELNSAAAKVKVTYFHSVNLNEKVEMFARDDVRAVTPGASYSIDSPQKVIASHVNAMLAKLKDAPEQWDGIYAEVIGRFLADTEMDSLLKLIVLRRLLQDASAGSYVIENASRPILTKIEDGDVASSANWLDPKDPTAAGEREKAKQVLRTIGDAAAFKRAVEEQKQAFAKPLGPRYRWVAFLDRASDAGKWQVRPSTLPQATQKQLYVLDKTTDGKIDFQPIGTYEAAALNAEGSQSLLRNGRPVYVLDEMPGIKGAVSQLSR